MARRFDGTNDTIAVANESNFDFERTSTFSFYAWISPDVVNVYQWLLGKLGSSTPGYLFGLTNTAEIYLILRNTGTTNEIVVKSSGTVAAKARTHIAVTYSGSSAAAGVTFYINGRVSANSVLTDNLSASMLNNTALHIGSNSGIDGFWDGIIAVAGVHNVVLTQAEILDTMRGANITRGQLAYWPLCGKQSPEPDLSGNGNSGTITGATAEEHPLWTCWDNRYAEPTWIQDSLMSLTLPLLMTAREVGSDCQADTPYNALVSLSRSTEAPEGENSWKALWDTAMRKIEQLLNDRLLANESCEACPDADGVVTFDFARCSNWLVELTDLQDINKINMVNALPGQDVRVSICNYSGSPRSVSGWPTSIGGGMPSSIDNNNCLNTGFTYGTSPTTGRGGFMTQSKTPVGAPGGGGGGEACCTSSGDLTIACCTPNCKFDCGKTTPLMTLEACGGILPYTWSTTAGTITPAGSRDQYADLTPPTNTGSGVAGTAYSQIGHHIGTGACSIIDTTEVKRGCNAQEISNTSGGGCSTFADCESHNCGPALCSDSVLCTQKTPCPSGNSLAVLQANPSAGAICDRRTQQMIDDGCQPCAVAMAGAVVTVTDATGDSISIEIT